MKLLLNIKIGVELFFFRWIFYIDLVIWILKKMDNKLLCNYLIVIVGKYIFYGGEKSVVSNVLNYWIYKFWGLKSIMEFWLSSFN